MIRQELHPHTAIINKEQKKHSKKARNEALLWLIRNFPEAFDNSQRIRPLKKGILQDVLNLAEKAKEEGISKSKLREALVLFTRRLDYLACLKAKELRIDLQGLPVDCVTEDEAEKAALKIKKRIEKGFKNMSSTKFGSSDASTLSSAISAMNYNKMPTENWNSKKSNKAATSCIIKHKTVRQFDPTAVARLREKLGLKPSE